MQARYPTISRTITTYRFTDPLERGIDRAGQAAKLVVERPYARALSGPVFDNMSISVESRVRAASPDGPSVRWKDDPLGPLRVMPGVMPGWIAALVLVAAESAL